MLDLEILNSEQRKAVESDSNTILCLAGAGSGKTRVLTYRIAQRVLDRIGPSNIVAITFTRLATKEMKERLTKLLDEEQTKALTVNTFHSFCLRWLKKYPHLIERNEDFSIYDQRDKEDVLKAIISDQYFKTTVNKVLKNHELPPESLVWQEYQYKLHKFNAIDIEMIQPLFLSILENPFVRAEIRNRYNYYFVDEFQDTDDIQLKILQRLNPDHLFVVGDDFQSIYKFRGAQVENILRFPKLYPDCETVVLERNYRSSKQIVDAANKLIKQNISQTEKKLETDKEGDFVSYITCLDQDDEVKEIAKLIKKLDKDFKDYAILCRTNKYAQSIYDRLEAQIIPCDLVTKQNDIFNTYDIRKVIAFIELAMNPKDEKKLMDTINFPVMNISNLDLKKCLILARKEEKELFDVLPEKCKERVLRFQKEAQECSCMSDFFWLSVEILDLENYYSKRDLIGKWNDLYEAQEKITQWEQVQYEMGESTGYNAFVRWLKIRDIQENMVKEEKNAVKVMTVHASKGLEFPVVFVPGLYEDHFPIKKADDMEEERRLFYVAITRAQEVLFLLYPKQIFYYGKQLNTDRSRFITEVNNTSF
jgi:DNA helicase II / ATP-dependent DNA helicase PcrA